MEQENNSKEIKMENTKASVVFRMGQVMQRWDEILVEYGLESTPIIVFPKYQGKPVPFIAKMAIKILNMYGAIIDIQFKHKLKDGVHS